MLLIKKLSMSSGQEKKNQLCEKYKNPSVICVSNQKSLHLFTSCIFCIVSLRSPCLHKLHVCTHLPHSSLLYSEGREEKGFVFYFFSIFVIFLFFF